jgi:hypothetical protein
MGWLTAVLLLPAAGLADHEHHNIAKAVAPPTSATPEPADVPPTEQKADGKAAREITPANYKAELAKVQKEIGGP